MRSTSSGIPNPPPASSATNPWTLARTVRTASGVVDSRDGRITLTFGDGSRRAVGAGAALAATAGGRFVLALRAGKSATEVVLYQLHY